MTRLTDTWIAFLLGVAFIAFHFFGHRGHGGHGGRGRDGGHGGAPKDGTGATPEPPPISATPIPPNGGPLTAEAVVADADLATRPPTISRRHHLPSPRAVEPPPLT